MTRSKNSRTAVRGFMVFAGNEGSVLPVVYRCILARRGIPRKTFCQNVAAVRVGVSESGGLFRITGAGGENGGKVRVRFGG